MFPGMNEDGRDDAAKVVDSASSTAETGGDQAKDPAAETGGDGFTAGTAETGDAAADQTAGDDLSKADAEEINKLVFGPAAEDGGEPAASSDSAVGDVGAPMAPSRPRRDAGLVISSTLKGLGGKFLKSKQLTTAAKVWAEGSEELGGYAAADFIAADVKDLLGEFELGRQFLAFLEGSDTGGLIGKLGSLGLSGVLVYQAMTKAIEADVIRLQQSGPAEPAATAS